MSWAAQAQTPAKDSATAPQSVVVTGSRIARARLEGPSPVTVITAEEITRQGYSNVFDALNNQVQNSGFTQGADYGNTFTPAANAANLRGLGPNHTLVLVNGRRLADFPIPYDGTVNFTNLANIPSSIVERIEILSGGASAVYGSDAVAGVINIVLKRQVQGVDVNVKAGGTSRGGGSTQRVQVTGGANVDKLNTLFSVELSHRDPLWASDRDFMSVRSGTPTTVVARKNVSAGGTFIDLGDACSELGDLFGGSVVKYAAKKGNYCASAKASPTHWTTQTKNNSVNLFGSANYELSSDTTLFGEVLLAENRTASNTRGPSWTSNSLNGSYFFNRNSNAYEAWTRFAAPEEYGDVERFNRNWKDVSTSLSFGAKGRIPGTRWDYEAGYSASFYQSRSHRPRPLSSIDSFFLGPKLGVDKDGVAIYAPDPARLTKRLTQAEFESIYGVENSNDRSWTNTASFTATGEVFQLPAGPLKLATVAELGRQGFSTSPDSRINEGFFNLAPTTSVTAGTRNRQALGIEASIPLLPSLTSTLATRYDRYSFAGRSEAKPTYNAGLEWRPAASLLLRGNYATSLRAPDMNYIYQARGTGYFQQITDHYRCAEAGKSIASCEYANVSPGSNYVQNGNKNLQSERGRSFGAGAVWSPSNNFDVTLDYWNIRIDNLVRNLNEDQLLRDEADCRLGRADINSASCADTLSRVQRYPLSAVNQPGEIKEIFVSPINAAFQSSNGIDVSGRYALRTAGYGTYVFKGAYSKTLAQKSRQFAADATKDDLQDFTNYNWRDKVNFSVNWSGGDWSQTVLFQRFGKIPNAAQNAFLSPTTLVNASTVYRVNKRTTLTLAVNNLFNKVKMDSTAGWPNYPTGSYSPVGRQGWLELSHHFGS